jgi:hypothetical protein
MVIRVWRAEPVDYEAGRTGWHVSIADRSPMQELRRLEGKLESLGGLCWDEALEAVALAMICPRALALLHLEPPVGVGWLLVAEISPAVAGDRYADGLFYFRVATRTSGWHYLTLGEALATFVREAAPPWKGFRPDVITNSFALVAQKEAPS